MSRMRHSTLYRTCSTCGHATSEATGAQLRAVRESAGTSLTDLAATAGVSLSLLSLIETGKRRASLAVLQHYAALQEGHRTRATA